MNLSNVVICGGGFSGMLAAIVCSRHAESVTVIEPFPDSEVFHYAGTPQSHHVHIMSKKGQLILEKLMPGSLDQLRSAGAIEVDWAQNTAWESPEGRCPQYISGLRSLLFSRKLLERFLYSKINEIPQVRIRQARVKDFVIQDGQVRDIILIGDEKISDFDLCLDARGRTSRLKETLEPFIGMIPETIIPNTLRYITTTVDRDETASEEAVQQYYSKANGHDNPLGYFASPIEGGRLIVTAVDYHGTISRPFERLQSHPFLKDKDLGSIHTFAKLHNRHIHYERCQHWPSKLLALGDAVCRLNPMYGHGLTLSLEHIEILESHLASAHQLNTRRVQKKIGASIKVPWGMVAMDESRALAGPPSIAHRFVHRFSDLMGTVVLKDKDVHRASIEVLHRVRSPLTFLSPLILLRALKVHWDLRSQWTRLAFAMMVAILSLLLSSRTASAADVHSRMISAHGEVFHILESGDAKSPLVLFLHGFPDHAGIWRKYLEDLGQIYHAVAVDQRGYNLSTKPEEEAAYRLPVLVEDVRRIVLALGHEQAFLVAHDWGGLVAWHAVARHPAMFKKLIVLNAPHPHVFAELLRHDKDQRKRSQYVGWLKGRWADVLLSFHDHWILKRSLQRTTLLPLPSEVEEEYQSVWSRGLAHSLKYYRANDFTSPAFRSIRPTNIPTLVLWGEKDEWLSRKNLEGLEVWVSQLSIKRFPNATHWIVREELDSVLEEIHNFLN